MGTRRKGNRERGTGTRRALGAVLVAALALVAMSGGCRDSAPAPKAEKLGVFVSIPPQVFFVERIGGAAVTVEPLVGAGANPHTFTPTPKQMTRMARADLYLAIGVEFETAVLNKIGSAYPNLTVVRCQEGIALRGSEDEHHDDDGHDHEHESGDDHGHAHEAPAKVDDASQATGGHDHAHGQDAHVWLDPLRAKQIARNVCRALQTAAPERAETFAANLETLERELDAAHARLAERLAPYRGRTVFVYHPAYGYFMDRYGLHQSAVEVAGRGPTASELAKLIRDMRTANARVLYFEPRFDRSNAEQIAQEVDVQIEALDPLAADYLQNLDRIADALVRGWSTPS